MMDMLFVGMAMRCWKKFARRFAEFNDQCELANVEVGSIASITSQSDDEGSDKENDDFQIPKNLLKKPVEESRERA